MESGEYCYCNDYRDVLFDSVSFDDGLACCGGVAMKGIVGIVLGFALLLAISIGLSSYDEVAVSVTRAQTGAAIGMPASFAMETLISWGLRAVLGGVFSGFAIFIFSEARKAYNAKKRNRRRGRWVGGPNANFGKVNNSVPKLSRSDLMLLALAGKAPKSDERPASLGKGDFPNDDFEMEF